MIRVLSKYNLSREDINSSKELWNFSDDEKLIWEGLRRNHTMKEISIVLGKSYYTVRKYINQFCEKVNKYKG